MKKVKITHHASQRFAERTNLSVGEQKHIATQGYATGLRLAALADPLYSFVLSKSIDGKHYQVRIFRDCILVYDTNYGSRGEVALITMYPVPSEYLPVSNYIMTREDERSVPCLILVHVDGKDYFVSEDCDLTEDIVYALEFKTRNRAINYVKNNRNLVLSECEFIDMVM